MSRAHSPWLVAWKRLSRNRTAAFGVGMLAVILLACFLAPFYIDYQRDVVGVNIAQRLQFPAEGMLLGADELGLAAVAGPDEDAPVLEVEQRLGALERGVELGDAAAELDVLGRGAGALADQQHGRQHRRAGDADEQRELDHLHRADGEGQADIGRRAFLRPRRSRKGAGRERQAGEARQDAAPRIRAACEAGSCRVHPVLPCHVQMSSPPPRAKPPRKDAPIMVFP